MTEEREDRSAILDSLRGVAASAVLMEHRLGFAPSSPDPHGAVFRHLVAEEWLWEVLARNSPLSEDGLRRWTEEQTQLAIRDERRIGKLRREALQEAREWLDSAPRPAGLGAVESFSSLPASSTACAFYGWEVSRVYAFFSGFSRRDVGTGRATAGLMAVLLAQAVAQTPYRAGLGTWFFNTAGRSLDILRRAQSKAAEGAVHSAWLDRIEESVVEGYEAGGGILAEARELSSSGTAARGDRADRVEPLEFWRVLAARLSSEKKDLERLLASFEAGTPAEVWAARAVALLAGAWYGKAKLAELLGEEVCEAEAGLRRELAVDPEERAEMLFELSRMLSSPLAPQP
ncbi:MAG: hypothetical protein KDD47_06620 [Acidobacteria bacterium]|nr:hypothetical protein [Acidobacteriota bacterium]